MVSSKTLVACDKALYFTEVLTFKAPKLPAKQLPTCMDVGTPVAATIGQGIFSLQHFETLVAPLLHALHVHQSG